MKTKFRVKPVGIPEETHTRLKNKAKREGRKLYGLVQHLIEMGEKYEKNLTKR